jgi:hypothetical protein
MSNKLAAWDVWEEDFPSKGNNFDQLKFLLNHVVLSPLGRNTQSRRFSIKSNNVSLVADFARALPQVDPVERTLYKPRKHYN